MSRERALQLLGSGVPAESVASALGVTASYISQLLSEPEFKEAVSELRFTSLQRHNERDLKLDSLEDQLITKLENSLAYCCKPMELVKAFQVVNGAKRRGSSMPDHITNTQNIVQLILPIQVINKFTTNTQNQVVCAGDQELLTIQSGTLLREIKESQNEPAPARNTASYQGREAFAALPQQVAG